MRLELHLGPDQIFKIAFKFNFLVYVVDDNLLGFNDVTFARLFYCTEYKNVLGATVTRFCGKYGLVDDSIYFTSNDVLGGMPLQVGQKVNIVAQKNETSGGWKAVKCPQLPYWDKLKALFMEELMKLAVQCGITVHGKAKKSELLRLVANHFSLESEEAETWLQVDSDRVEPITRQWDDDTHGIYSDSPAESETHNLMGIITSCTKDGGYINETIYFTMTDVCEGFQPYKGDWVQAQYSIEQTTWKSQAYCMKPLRYKRVDKVPVTRILHRSGVVDDFIFFTLESLRLPHLYVPKKDDLVNLVIIESNQSLYQWRALCIAPAEKESLSVLSMTDKELGQIDLEFSNKEGLEVTRNIDFGTIKQGEKKNLMVWIENKGKETHRLLNYKLAGWERGNQFFLASPQVVIVSEIKAIEQQSPSEFASVCRVTRSQSSCMDLSPSLPRISVQPDSKFPYRILGHTNVPTPCEITSYQQDVSHGSQSTQDKLYNSLPSASASLVNRLSCSQACDDADVKCEKMQQKLSTNAEIGETALQILPGGKVYINLVCEAKNPGRCKDLLFLYFNGFVMGRYVEVNVMSDEESLLEPRSRYQPIQPRSFQTDQRDSNFRVVSVKNPTRLARRHIPSFLPQYAVPERLKECIEKGADVLTIQPNLMEAMTMSKYKDHFSTLLWLEEITAEAEISEFNMAAVVLKKQGDFLILEVPGLVEGRPSVTIGDRIILKNSCYTEAEVRYSGFVTEVCDDELVLKFNASFHQAYGGEPMDVEFKYNRISTRRCQFAVEQAVHLGEAEKNVILVYWPFPEDSDCNHCYVFDILYDGIYIWMFFSSASNFPFILPIPTPVLFPENVVAKTPQTVTTWNDIDTVVSNKKKSCCRSQDQSKKEQDVDAKLSSSCTGKADWRQDTGKKVAPERTTEMCVSEELSVTTQTGYGGNHIAEPSKGQEYNFFNSLLNDYQKSAVKRILRGECRPTPYILFGPPGTGKTVTILEAILQIHFTLPHSRILASAPSNSAADLLCLRLHESNLLKQGDMVRVNATCRPGEYIPEIVQLYSKDGEDLWDAARCRIIISTCSTAALFYQIGLRTGHFTHVFVDEAGQASEPECLIPLLLVSEEDGQIVLAGDPMQLGPIIKSRIATAYGLSVSLLERLMTRLSYSRDETFGAFGSYNPLLVTKLVNNYRSHSSLLDLPSKLFYHQELRMCIDQSVANKFCNWEKLPKKGFPIIFHGLRGNEMREGSNPSWFNPKEAVQVMRYCCLLAKHCTNPVQPSDIGVIAPYQKQVQKIRILLRSGYLSDIKVGSVEEFQGREKLVIVVSTVRSCEENLSEDTCYVLGFLSNPKRFNVAITRAKALLIVVGNPHILLKDPCWGAFLEYCVENDAYIGCNLPHELLAQWRHSDSSVQ
ncbi:RNA helicase Mov10l1 [Heterodontus francisci]|uniref:RNA helicase Mov10l1 n=1 Tax=Heterodontus francisci TaxID=7792 RepID=UPI00355C155A